MMVRRLITRASQLVVLGTLTFLLGVTSGFSNSRATEKLSRDRIKDSSEKYKKSASRKSFKKPIRRRSLRNYGTSRSPSKNEKPRSKKVAPSRKPSSENFDSDSEWSAQGRDEWDSLEKKRNPSAKARSARKRNITTFERKDRRKEWQEKRKNRWNRRDEATGSNEAEIELRERSSQSEVDEFDS